MPATRPIDELRREAAGLIISHIEQTNMSKTAAAAELDVSRQALYDILNKKYCPSLALIQRACEIWGLEFNFRGLHVGKKTLRPKTRSEHQPIQRNLMFEALGLLEKGHLEIVKAKRRGQEVDLLFRFKLPA